MELLNTPHSNNVRYQLAKQQLNQLFLKWISSPNNTKFVHQLIADTKFMQQNSEGSLPSKALISPPSPIFAHSTIKMNSPSHTSSSLGGSGSITKSPHTPPRSPSAADKYAHISPKISRKDSESPGRGPKDPFQFTEAHMTRVVASREQIP